MDALTNCARKERFPTKAAAQAALARWRAAVRAGSAPKITGTPRAYRCKTGKHWHIGRLGGVRGSRRRGARK